MHGVAPTAICSTSVGVEAGLTPADTEMLARQGSRPPRTPYVVVHHYVPGAGQQVADGMPNVARVMFETDSLPRTGRTGPRLTVDFSVNDRFG